MNKPFRINADGYVYREHGNELFGHISRLVRMTQSGRVQKKTATELEITRWWRDTKEVKRFSE